MDWMFWNTGRNKLWWQGPSETREGRTDQEKASRVREGARGRAKLKDTKL